MQPHLVIQKFDEFHHLEQKIVSNWERFQSGKSLIDQLRSVVLSSWKRCKQHGRNLHLQQAAPILYQGDALKEKKEQNRLLLDAALPYIESVFHYDSNLSWVLSDQDGIILETKVNRQDIPKAEKIQFVPGADISEAASGTNATGIALIEEKPVQIFSAEHYLQAFHPFMASASVIRDPFTQKVLGVLHISGEKDVVQVHNISLLMQSIHSIQKNIQSNLLEQNALVFEAIFNMNENPILVFDANGKIIRYNTGAKNKLRVQVGDSLSKIMEIPFPQQEWKQTLLKGLQSVFRIIDGGEWTIQFQPIKLGACVYGGVATFQNKIHKSPANPVRTRKDVRYGFCDILTQDEHMLKVVRMAKKAAFSDKTVLITGETGTGKEILAQSIHADGSRQMGPFIEVNCGAIPRELVASELFGYEGGAFTGAKAHGKKGKFVLADQGTIFLDEIGDLPLDIQVYLLRVLEERTVVPVGGSMPIPINVRVIGATNKNLEEEVRKGNFREDLLHRLNIISLNVPALRERGNDMALLVHRFLALSSEREELPTVEDEVMEVLCAYHWPGNIRQLKNVIDKMIFHSDGLHIRLEDIPSEIKDRNPRPTHQLKETMEDDGKQHYRKLKVDNDSLLKVLKQSNGNISEAAKMLNVSRMTIYRKLKEMEQIK